MKVLKEITVLLLVFYIHISCSPSIIDAHNDLLSHSIPGVSGFGQDAIGGKGGKIIVVNNLNRDGEGSLRAAIDSEGPRIVVFSVAGVIDLERSSLRIRNPHITIAGQTAPSPGITLIKGGISINTHQVIIQHIKVRPGSSGENEKGIRYAVDGITTGEGASNVVIDHCTTTWGTDENLSVSGPRFEGESLDEWRKNTSHKITISNCIIAQALSISSEFDPTQVQLLDHRTTTRFPSGDLKASQGTLVHDNSTEVLIYGNLYADNMDRNPLCKGGSQVAIVNNYIFNPGSTVIHYGLVDGQWRGHEWVAGKMTVEGNYFEFGPHTSEAMKSPGLFNGPIELYWKDNTIIDQVKRHSGSYFRIHTGKGWDEVPRVDNRPIWPQGLVPLPSHDVKDWVLDNAGAFPWDRCDIDKKMIERIKAGVGQMIDSEIEVGGYPVIEPVYREFIADDWDLERMVRK